MRCFAPRHPAARGNARPPRLAVDGRACGAARRGTPGIPRNAERAGAAEKAELSLGAPSDYGMLRRGLVSVEALDDAQQGDRGVAEQHVRKVPARFFLHERRNPDGMRLRGGRR